MTKQHDYLPHGIEIRMVTEISWHEVAHPQIHGHDINTISITKGEGNHHYVSRVDFFS